MVHHVELGWDILVEIRLWQIVRHVVEEVDVGERPAGEGLCVRANLGNKDGGWRNDKTQPKFYLSLPPHHQYSPREHFPFS